MSCVLNELMQYDDLSDFCRVCLRLPDKSQLLDLTKIYDEEKNLSFASCFTICTQIDLEALEGIPHNLCKSCGLELQIVYDFNKKIEESENILLEYENQLAIEGDETYLDDEKKDVAYNTDDFSNLDCNYEKDKPDVHRKIELKEQQHQQMHKEEDFIICKDNAFSDTFAKVCKSQENDDDDDDNDSIKIIEEDLIVTTVSSSSSEFDEEDLHTNLTPFEEESRQNNQPVCNQVNFNEFVDFMEAYNNELFGEDVSEVAPANGGDHDYIKKEMEILSTVEPKTIDPDHSKDVSSNSQELEKFEKSLFQKDNDGDIDMIGEANDDNIKKIKIEIPISSLSGIIYDEDIEIKQEPPFEEEQTNIELPIATTTINSVISEEAIEIKQEQPLEDEQMNIDIPISTITKEALEVQPSEPQQMVKTNNRSLLKPLPAKVNNRYVCDGCDKIFGDIGSLLIHRSYKCLKYHCNYCEKAYTKKLSLTRHISVAHQKNYNSHSCSICKKFFVRANKLQQHMLNYHKDQLPFKCSLCDRKYSLAKTLKSHEKLKHSNERLYCSYEACDRVFSCPTNLRHHEYLHNEMPYECDLCNIGCASKDKLRCHLKQRHNVVEVESDMFESEENELISTSEPKAIAEDDINEVSFNSQEWKEFEIRLFQSDNDADSENGKIKKIRIGIPISSSTAAIISEEAIEIQEEQPFENEQTDIEIPISETAGVNTIISKEAIAIKEALSVADEQMKIEIPSSSISEEAIDIKEEHLSEEEEEQPSEEEEEQPFEEEEEEEEEEQPFEKEEEEHSLEDEQMNIKISSISEKQTFEQQQMVKTKSYEPNLLKKSNNIYTCDNCEEKFSDFGSMIIHRSYKCYKYHCTYCKKGFQEKLVYSRHLSVAHRKNISFSCSICKKLFAGADKLKHHMQRFHHKGGQLSFKCSLCDRKYSKAKYLITHEQLKHADQRCSYKACGRIFSCPTSLRQHEYSHGEMPFECNLCKTGCPSKYKLKCHLKNIHNILELDIKKLESMRKFKKKHSKANTVVPANDADVE